MISKKKLMKKKKPLIVILLSFMLVGVLVMNQETLIGIATGIITFDNDDGVAAQCSVSAVMSAYGEDGLITAKTFQSGFYIEGEAVEYIRFEVTLVFSGANVDWNTLDMELEMWVRPYGQSDILLASSINSLADLENVTGDYKFYIDIHLGDTESDPTAIDLATLLGNSVLTQTSLSSIKEYYVLDILTSITASVIDLKDQQVDTAVNINASWSLYTYEKIMPEKRQ